MESNTPFGKRCGFNVPAVNIGAMRFPEDDDEAVALIRNAIDSGMTYIDTSRGYGPSEIKLGKALKDGYRDKVILSTKCSPWITKIEETDDTSADCTRRRIEESMARLDVDYLDFYQVWNIDSREHYDMAVAKGGMVDGIRKAMDDGLVGHTGFTTHDSVENILTYVEEADWCEIILFTYNLLNETYAPAIEAAHKNGIGTVIMNPIGGGILTQPSDVLIELAGQVGATSVPDLGIRYVLSNPYVDAIISGISNVSDVEACIASGTAPRFSSDQMALIQSRIGSILSSRQAFCTGCRYCLPCPQGIDIPAVMDMVAQQRFWGFEETARGRYAGMTTPKADACVTCGECEAKCTQHLGIMEEMGFAANTFGGGAE
jgi:uncharacterized protein